MKSVSQGKTIFSSQITKMLVEDYFRAIRDRGVEDSYELLTSREREILHLLAQGTSNRKLRVRWDLALTRRKHIGKTCRKAHGSDLRTQRRLGMSRKIELPIPVAIVFIRDNGDNRRAQSRVSQEEPTAPREKRLPHVGFELTQERIA